MTVPEQHAATVRAALDAGASAESLGQFRRGERPEAYVAVDALEAFAAAREAAEARADELQRERDAALAARRHVYTQPSGPDDVVGHDGWECDAEKCDACYFRSEAEQARREADQLRAALRESEAVLIEIASKPYRAEEATANYFERRRLAALAGVQAEEQA